MKKLGLLAWMGLALADEQEWPTYARNSMVRQATSTGGSEAGSPDESDQIKVFSTGFQVSGSASGDETYGNLGKKSGCRGFTEELRAVGGGAQYVSDVYVGYQKFSCILDTSSFDLSIIGMDGRGFVRSKARFHKRFPNPHAETKDIIFSSGPARIRKAKDFVALVKNSKPSQSCRAQQCPIGTIVKTTMAELQLDDDKREYDGVCGIAMGPKDKSQNRFVSQMDVKRIGICFQKDISKGGVAHWNYNAKKKVEEGFKFSTLTVVGPYWAMALTNSRAELGTEQLVLGCQDSPCLTVMDSSSSLYSLDSSSISKVRQIMGERHLPCDESLLEVLPTFCYNDENGNSLCIKPEDYVYKMSGDYTFEDIPAYIRESLAFTPQNLPNFLGRIGCRCILLIGSSTEKHMHILGMPWFKSFWWGFETGSSSISWSRHDGSCNAPTDEAEPPAVMREINPTKLQPSALAVRLEYAKKSAPQVFQAAREQIGLAQFDSDEL